MKVAVIALALCSMPLAAGAQIVFGPAQAQEPAIPGRDPVIRITTNFQSLATPAASLGQTQAPNQPDPTGAEAVRRDLYQLAAGECAILRDVYKAECRLLSVTLSPQPGTNVWPPRLMTATAAYELRAAAP